MTLHAMGLAEPQDRVISTDVRQSRRTFTLLMVALMLLTGLAGIAKPQGARAGVAGTINIEGAALMAGMDDQSVLEWLPLGARVDVFWGPEDDRYQVRYYETVGYVWAAYLDVDGGANVGGGSDSGSSEVAWTESSWAMVATDTVNVRADASTDAAVWDQYSFGQWIEVVGGEVNGFVPVNYYGDTAWVYAGNLSWDGSVAAPATESSSNTGGGEHWIDVNITTGEVTLFVGSDVYAVYWGSIGRDRSGYGYNSTAVGTYYVYRMHQPLAWSDVANGYMTDWVAFDPERNNGFHSWMKTADGSYKPNGAGWTAGCVSTPSEQSRVIYDFSYIGMRVEIHW